MTKKKDEAIKAIDELIEYTEGYFHNSWIISLNHLKELVNTYPEPKEKV